MSILRHPGHANRATMGASPRASVILAILPGVTAAAGALLPAALLAVTPAIADVRSISASKDNTLYETAAGDVSNGAGQVFFAGHTGTITNSIRRGLIAFDVAGSIPAGSTINSVTLRLHLTRVPAVPVATVISLHRVLANWGEGASDPAGQEGGGAPAEVNDATWLYRFFNTTLWAVQGGEFVTTASASRQVLDIGPYSWGPSAGMRTDVQSWLNNPAGNFGWMLRGDEVTVGSAHGFDTRQGLTAADRPVLDVTYMPPITGAGRVPDGAAPDLPLTVTQAAGGQITLAWDTSCVAGDTDYEIYEGSVGAFYSHSMKLCTTGGATTATFMPAPGDSYYLVVPRQAGREGSYGFDSAVVERPPGVPACLPQLILECP
jgi:hypothetical protein